MIADSRRGALIIKRAMKDFEHRRRLGKQALAIAAQIAACFSCNFVEPCLAFDRSHRLFTAELKKYVTPAGVHYERWQRDQEGLERYLKSLADLSADDYNKFSAADRKALWLDVYDALTIKVVLDHYPIKGTIPYYPEHSLRQIPDVWERFFIDVAGRNLNLYQIEHDILRREVKDTRTHFAVSCAAKGAGATPSVAYTAKNLEHSLAKAKHVFLFNPKNVDIDQEHKTVNVSRLFKWFPLDFASEAGFDKIPFPPPTDDEIVLGYLSQNGPSDLREILEDSSERKKYKVVYRDFDWSLNDADEAESAPGVLKQ